MTKKIGPHTISAIAFGAILGVVFSPLVLSEGEHGPWVLGMPRTLWTGILASLLLFLFAFYLAMKIDVKTQE